MSQLNVFSLHQQAPGTLLWPLLVPVMGTSKKWSLKVTPPVSCMRTYPYARGTQWDLTLYLTWNANMSMWWQTRKCQRYVLLWHFEVMFLLYFVIPTLFSGLFFSFATKRFNYNRENWLFILLHTFSYCQEFMLFWPESFSCNFFCLWKSFWS